MVGSKAYSKLILISKPYRDILYIRIWESECILVFNFDREYSSGDIVKFPFDILL